MSEYKQIARTLLSQVAPMTNDDMCAATIATVLRAAQVGGMRKAVDGPRARELTYPALVVKAMADALDRVAP